MLFSPKRTAVFYVLVFTLAVTFVASAFHSKGASYTEIPKPIKDFFYTAQSHCPSVHDIGRPALDHALQTCHAVPSNHSSFSIEVCYTAHTCNQFTARIARTNQDECSDAESAPDPNEDPGITRWMREQMGPDTFYLRTDGAERYASVMPKYEGGCSYAFDVRLKNPGDVFLQIWWTEQRYTGFSDTNSSWPEMLLYPLSAPVHMRTCASHCSIQIAKPLLSSNRIISIPAAHSSEFNADLDLPSCVGPEPIPGSFIPAHPMDVLYPPEVLPQPNDRPVMGRYNFVPESCVWRHAGLRFGDPSRCSARPARMFITGDSHGRVSYDTMLHRLNGNAWVLGESEKTGHKNGSVGQVDIDFQWDPRGLEFVNDDNACTDRLKDANVIVVSTVAHYDDMPTLEVFSQERKVLSTIAACPYTPTVDFPTRKLILLYGPAAVQRQDEFVIQYKDHGTNLRFSYWRKEIFKIAREHGFDIVDQFELTLPHSLEPLYTDMAHFLANDAMDPIVDELLGKSGLCEY